MFQEITSKMSLFIPKSIPPAIPTAGIKFHSKFLFPKIVFKKDLENFSFLSPENHCNQLSEE
jgi:hypothetical protein